MVLCKVSAGETRSSGFCVEPKYLKSGLSSSKNGHISNKWTKIGPNIISHICQRIQISLNKLWAILWYLKKDRFEKSVEIFWRICMGINVSKLGLSS
jgi:hypothetical protein